MVLGGLDETPVDTKTKKTNVLLANIFNGETMIYTRNAPIPKALEWCQVLPLSGSGIFLG